MQEDSKRIKQVKVNFNNEEFNILDNLKKESRTDRSSLLRRSFFKWFDLKKIIYKIKIITNNISKKNLNFQNNINEELKDSIDNLDEIQRDLLKNISSEKGKNLNKASLKLDESITKLNRLLSSFKELNSFFEKNLHQINQELSSLIDEDVGTFLENKEISSLSKASINETNNINKDIMILKITSENQKYELIDQLIKGASIISDFSKFMGVDNESNSNFEFIMGGVYALKAGKEKLSQSMYLFTPKEININKIDL